MTMLDGLDRRLRVRLTGTGQPDEGAFASELAVMARDRSIQAELQAIDREFQDTKPDGLARN